MFGGTGTAVVTPFKEGGVDFESFGRFLNWQIEGGVEFLVVLGTTGESPTVTADERAEIITFAVRTAAGRVPVVIGTGSNSTAGAVALSQQAEALGAEVLNPERGMDELVEKVMIGAMTPETALMYMRRLARKAIITGGDRADIQMAALSTDTSCLVLTGGLYPPKPVVAKAYEVGVPILVTRHNTMEAAEMIDRLIARIDPADEDKIQRIAEMVKRHVDLDAIWKD